jgi:hypothetical protein
MSDPAAPGPPDGLSEDVTADGVFRVVLEGYAPSMTRFRAARHSTGCGG